MERRRKKERIFFFWKSCLESCLHVIFPYVSCVQNLEAEIFQIVDNFGQYVRVFGVFEKKICLELFLCSCW